MRGQDVHTTRDAQIRAAPALPILERTIRRRQDASGRRWKKKGGRGRRGRNVVRPCGSTDRQQRKISCVAGVRVLPSGAAASELGGEGDRLPMRSGRFHVHSQRCGHRTGSRDAVGTRADSKMLSQERTYNADTGSLVTDKAVSRKTTRRCSDAQ